MSSTNPTPEAGPVVFAYDGSELADLAIEKAGQLFGDSHEALVVCVWQPFDLGFVPPSGTHLNAAESPEVKRAAELTAAAGAKRAEAAGFRSQSLAVEASPIWRGIVDVADQHDASVIVIGSHSRGKFAGAVAGSVARAVASNSRRTVLITHRHG